jgi:hypothetical protein
VNSAFSIRERVRALLVRQGAAGKRRAFILATLVGRPRAKARTGTPLPPSGDRRGVRR